MSEQRFCVVVPLFDHGAQLPRTLERLAVFGLPVILVDDGSGEATRRQAAEAAARDGIELVSLPVNRGKGAAVMAGLSRAAALGYTHAVQVDADGQHDIERLAELLAASRRAPSALVTGVPRFDASAPRARRYGRRITNFWVWIETLGRGAPDTMCGFRVYPVATMIDLMRRNRLGSRMQFDIEVAVRLHWRGVPTVVVPVDVTYPDDGVSHFRGWHDNLLISWLHTRLVFGMLARLPVLLYRSMKPSDGDHWSRVAERGTVLGMRVLLAVYRVLGRRAFAAVLHPVIAYFYATGRQARVASDAYLRRVEAVSGNSGLSVYRHMYRFGEAALDKVAVWAGRMPARAVRFADPEFAASVLRGGRGGLIIGSHLGNLEVCRAFADTVHGMAISALVFSRHAVRFNRLLAEVNPDATTNLVEVDELTPATLMQLQDRVAGGRFVAIVGDRTPPGNERRSVAVPFLGQPAPFPQGPFVIASLLECPVYLLFCFRSDDGHVAYLEPFADPLVLDRRAREAAVAAAATRYAARLEYHCLRRPYDWFNFFDFWRPAHEARG